MWWSAMNPAQRGSGTGNRFSPRFRFAKNAVKNRQVFLQYTSRTSVN
jgi:hypothetical protein